MGYALVSAGPVASTLAPSFGQPTTAGDLLVAWVFGNSSDATCPYSTAAVGWQLIGAGWGGPFGWGALFCRAGCSAGESPPSFSVAGGDSFEFSMLAEFSGGATSSVLDQSGNGGQSGATETATCTGDDGQPGDLIAAGFGWNGGAATPGVAVSMTDGAGASVAVTSYTNAVTASGQLYCFSWGVAGGGAVTQADSATAVLGAFSGGSAGIASFKPGGGAAPPSLVPPPISQFSGLY